MIALVKITSPIKTYEPGETLGSEFNEKDLQRLRRLKAVEGSEDAAADLDENIFGADDTDTFLTNKELTKLNKSKLVEYAESIGLGGLTAEMSKEDLMKAVLNYTEEMENTEE